MQTLEYHGGEVFLCYTHTPSEAKVSLTEDINIHACGGELDDYTRSHTIESVFKFSCVEFANQCGGSKTTSFTKKWMWSKIKIWRMLQWTIAGRSQMYCPASRV